MARAYGLDLRRRVIEAIDSGMSARKAAGRFAVGVATAISWHRRWREQGSLEPGRQGKPSRSRLEPHEDFIVALMQEQPDIALHEMVDRLAEVRGLRVGKTTLWKFLNRHGWTYKKDRARGRAAAAGRARPQAGLVRRATGAGPAPADLHR